MSTPGLSEEACKAVNAGFDAMSTWRIETAKYGREKQRASAREDDCSCSGVGITGGNRARQPRANAEHHQNAVEIGSQATAVEIVIPPLDWHPLKHLAAALSLRTGWPQ